MRVFSSDRYRAAAFALIAAFALVLAGGAAACSSSSSGAAPGTVPSDAVPADGGTEQQEASSDASSEGDGPLVSDILGTLTSGSCGLIKAELTAPSPSFETNLLVFVVGESYARTSLSPGGQTLFDTANAGGSSTESEVMSFEVLHYCEGASLLKTETQIAYQPPDDAAANSITDILVQIGGMRVGVSVTRAYKPPTQPPQTDAELKALLEKKLEGIVRSSQRVLPQDKWVKQILHVLSVSQAATDAIGRVLPTIDAALRADTIVLVTQTLGGGFLYCNPDPPLGSECK